MQPFQKYDIVALQRNVRKAVEDALRTKAFIKYNDKIFMPSEFVTYSERQYEIKTENISFVNPQKMVENGKKKLYELFTKQLEFEKKVDEYLSGKID